MVGKREPRNDRHLRVDQVGKAAIERRADQGIDPPWPFQERALHLQECRAIPGSGLCPDLLRDSAPRGTRQT
jgi:hypothetical protein